MIRALVDFALNNKFVVMAIAILLIIWGAISFHELPVEAYPDIADNYATIITQWPGRSAEEVEQQVTIPIEIQMAGMPHMTYLRSESIFGLSFVIMIFDDSSVNDWNRQKVLERLTQVNLPQGLQPRIGTDWSTVGQIYWYTLRSANPRYDLMELRSLEDFVLLKQFKSVPNVVDVSDFGGTVREYQVRVDPNKLVSYGLSIGQVEQQLSNTAIDCAGPFTIVGLSRAWRSRHWREPCTWGLAVSLEPSSCHTWMKGPSGRAARWRTAPVFRRAKDSPPTSAMCSHRSRK